MNWGSKESIFVKKKASFLQNADLYAYGHGSDQVSSIAMEIHSCETMRFFTMGHEVSMHYDGRHFQGFDRPNYTQE